MKRIFITINQIYYTYKDTFIRFLFEMGDCLVQGVNFKTIPGISLRANFFY